MIYKVDWENYLVRVAKGERLGESLDKFMSETGVEGAWVSGIGAASELTMGLYQPEPKITNGKRLTSKWKLPRWLET